MALTKPHVGTLLNPIHQLSRGLVGYWLLGEGGGLRVNDSSYGNNPGVLTSFTGNPWVGSHHGGQALKFDGSASYVKISAAPVTTYPLAMGAWVKLSTTTLATSGEMVVGGIVNTSSLDEFWFGYFNNAGTIKFRSVAQSNAGANARELEATVVLDLNWHFLLVVFINATTHAVYYDGVLQSSASYVTAGAGNPAPAGLNTTSIGGFFYNTSTFYGPLPGAIEGLFILNRIPAASEVAQLYADSYARFASDDVDFAPPSGIAFDAAGNSGDQAAASSYSGAATWNGTNRFLAVDVSMLGAGVTVTAMTYGGANCTLIGVQSTVTSFGRVEQWGICSSAPGAPAAGSNTLSITLSGSLEFAAEWASYNGVSQSAPTEGFNSAQATNAGVATDASVAITSVTDNCWIHAAVVANDTSITAGQTSRNNISGTLGSGANEDNNAVVHPAGSTTMNYSGMGITTTWAIAGYAIRPVNLTDVLMPQSFG